MAAITIKIVLVPVERLFQGCNHNRDYRNQYIALAEFVTQKFFNWVHCRQ